MLYKNWLFLAAGFISVCIFAHPSVAVPTVRKLGTSASNNVHSDIQNRSTTPVKTSTAMKRAPSVRILGPSAKTTTKAVGNVKSVKTASTTAESTDSSRLFGLHGNLIKGIGSKLSQNYTPQTSGISTSDLEQRVNALEEEMITKQEVLQPGGGLVIDGKTIGLSEEIATLPEQIEEINQKIADLNTEVSTDNYYTISETQTYVQQIVSQLANANVVKQFDPTFLHQSENQNGQP